MVASPRGLLPKLPITLKGNSFHLVYIQIQNPMSLNSLYVCVLAYEHVYMCVCACSYLEKLFLQEPIVLSGFLLAAT